MLARRTPIIVIDMSQDPNMPEGADGRRVLVVDDEPNIVEVITMALRFQGFTVETAATGREALAAVASFKPHLMVLDVMLPDMEGFEVADATRRAARRRADHLPDRPRRHRGQGPRAHRRRRRLHDQALQPRGARRPHPHDPAPHRPGRPGVGPARPFEDLELDEESRRGDAAPASRSSSPPPSTGCCAT